MLLQDTIIIFMLSLIPMPLHFFVIITKNQGSEIFNAFNDLEMNDTKLFRHSMEAAKEQ